MQIGNYVQYSNVDALGSNLTYNGPCKYSAKAIQSNCFYLNTQLDFGAYNVLGDVHLISFWFKATSTTFNSERVYAYNLFPNTSFTEYFNYWYIAASSASHNSTVFIGKRAVYFSIDKLYDYDWHFIEFGWIGEDPLLPDSIIFKIDGIQVTYTAESTSAKNLSNSHPPMFNICNADICNISMYDGNGTLIHHYPCAEGCGRILYDTVGNVHATTRSNSNTTIWSHTQDFYHYNLINGYISIDGDDCNRFLNTLKVPLKDTSEVLIMKDNWDSGINNYSKYGAGTTATCSLKSDTDGSKYFNANVAAQTSAEIPYLFRYTLCTEFNGIKYSSSISSPYLHANYNYWNTKNPVVEVTYKFKFKYRINSYVKNDESKTNLPLFRGFISYGNTNDVLGWVNLTNLNVDATWKEYETTFKVGADSATYSSSLATTINAFLLTMGDSTLTADDTISLDFDLKDIRLYRISNCTYHPPILNGHNGAETKFNFSQGVSDVAEVRNDLLYAYRPGLMETADESLGANGSMRANGWSGAMDTITSAGSIANGLWAIYYNKTGNANNGYIDNYTLTDEELDKMGLSSAGVAAQAVQFTSIGSIISSATQNVTLYYRVNLSNLFGKLVFPNVLGWSYRVHFTGWVKKLVEYNANLQLATGYQSVLQPGGQVLIPESEFTDNEFHYIDKTLSFYYPNYQNSATSTATHYIGLGAYPSGYTSFINPDTGVAYTATEAYHKPTLALAKVKITFEPQEVYFKDGKGFKLMNFNNNSLSRYQSKRQNNQTTFNLS